MEPMKFEQANKELLKPQGMTDEECGSLPVFTDGKECISLWLSVYSGQTQPPVWLMAAKQIFKKVEQPLEEVERG
jgi:hypothetical protein